MTSSGKTCAHAASFYRFSFVCFTIWEIIREKVIFFFRWSLNYQGFNLKMNKSLWLSDHWVFFSGMKQVFLGGLQVLGGKKQMKSTNKAEGSNSGLSGSDELDMEQTTGVALLVVLSICLHPSPFTFSRSCLFFTIFSGCCCVFVTVMTLPSPTAQASPRIREYCECGRVERFLWKCPVFWGVSQSQNVQNQIQDFLKLWKIGGWKSSVGSFSLCVYLHEIRANILIPVVSGMCGVDHSTCTCRYHGADISWISI